MEIRYKNVGNAKYGNGAICSTVLKFIKLKTKKYFYFYFVATFNRARERQNRNPFLHARDKNTPSHLGKHLPQVK